MLKSTEIRRQVAQRLRELFPRAKGWEESADARIGPQTVDLLVKFRLGEQEHALVVEVSSLGQPRQIRAAVTRLAEARRELPGALPVAAAVYIGPQSARILKGNNLGFIDLSGNCFLAFGNIPQHQTSMDRKTNAFAGLFVQCHVQRHQPGPFRW